MKIFVVNTGKDLLHISSFLYDRCVCTNVSTTVCFVCLEDIAQVMQMTCINVPLRCLTHISVMLCKT